MIDGGPNLENIFRPAIDRGDGNNFKFLGLRMQINSLRDKVDGFARWLRPTPDKEVNPLYKKIRGEKTTLKGAAVRTLVRLATALGVGFATPYAIKPAGMVLDLVQDPLPRVDTLPADASQFQTSVIQTGNGEIVDKIIPPDKGLRTYRTLDEMSPYVPTALIATEDRGFLVNWGFSPKGIIAAIVDRVKKGEFTRGGSTITQGLAELVYIDNEQYPPGTFDRKIREILLAHEIFKKFPKEQVLELYANEAYFGYGNYGLSSAAEFYFGKNVKDLTLGESVFIAGLIQSPEGPNNPFVNYAYSMQHFREVMKNLRTPEDWIGRQVDCKLAENGKPIRLCFSDAEVDAAIKEIENYEFKLPTGVYQYKPWVNVIEGQLHKLFPGDSYYNAGVKVETTIDLSAQKSLDEGLSAYSTDSGVVVDSATGAVLAMSGDIMPTNVRIITPEGEEINLIDLVVAFEASKPDGKFITPHTIARINKIKNGSEVCGVVPLNAESCPVDDKLPQVNVTSLSNGESVPLSDGSFAVVGFSESEGGFRYTYVIGSAGGKTIVYWTSTSDQAKALEDFTNLKSGLKFGGAQKVISKIMTPRVSLRRTGMSVFPEPPVGVKDEIYHTRDSNIVFKRNPESGWYEPFRLNLPSGNKDEYGRPILGRFISDSELSSYLLEQQWLATPQQTTVNPNEALLTAETPLQKEQARKAEINNRASARAQFNRQRLASQIRLGKGRS